MTVTIVSSVYGDYDWFVERWLEAVVAMNPAPDDVIIAGDCPLEADGVRVIVKDCGWKHPNAFYFHEAARLADTDWVWPLGIDDTAMPDALAGIDKITADVWQMGYQSAFQTFLPSVVPNHEYVALNDNLYVGASAIRTKALKAVGGYRDVTFEDWDLWRRLAQSGAVFEASGRAHFHYNQHSAQRSRLEHFSENHQLYVADMLA